MTEVLPCSQIAPNLNLVEPYGTLSKTFITTEKRTDETSALTLGSPQNRCTLATTISCPSRCNVLADLCVLIKQFICWLRQSNISLLNVN